MPERQNAPDPLRLGDYDEREAAVRLGVSARTLQRWRKANRIDHLVLPGGRVRYSEESLSSFVASCRRLSSSGT